MKEYKMRWGDVTRMLGDFKFPPSTFDKLEFAPLKKDYDNNPAKLREALVASFRACSKKLSVAKWVIAETGIPPAMEGYKQSKSKTQISFIKIEEPKKKAVKKVVKKEEPKEEEVKLEEKGVELWQQS